MKVILVCLAVLFLAVGSILVIRWRSHAKQPSPEGLFVAPSSESQARAAAVLPTHGSEDQSALLRPPPAPVEAPVDKPDYLPDPRVDWSVRAKLLGSPRLQRSQILSCFTTDWLAANGRPELYGRALEDGRWTYLRAGGVPELYSELAFGWRLAVTYDESWTVPSSRTLAGYREALRKRLASLGDPLLQESSTPDQAAKTAADLAQVIADCDHRATVVLTAPSGKRFDGRDIWDVMLSLGLEWGDMDVFHWANHSGVGGDSLFSVWTSTPPGYFFPEEIAAGKVYTSDLVFDFSIPRSPDPHSVLESMLRAAEYAQRRLGGVVRDSQGRPLDPIILRREITLIEGRLREAGFKPGRDSTLYIF